ncbi:efflux RND transporter periplasmic adaptor subunit [Geosporobacter ferrireducens]|uniref:efflux RND transporter periplasmic adaptor subunit n=1 Tax=Geosporobacter ferrireducens TaxID=1424294 RepID=UPI00139C5DD5|nr:HlyD family efflux transporter periplasmic adaptor subunit [Geosporobacter ferrireducens]MTI57076.1 HlyD family efflux transporter periplasmic adaptor subunit [Geosporobacter ferrireducens]
MNISKKNILLFCIVTIAIFSLLGFGGQNQTEVKEGKVVTVQKIIQSNYPVGIDYLGYVKAKETKNYSFITGGRIEEIYVRKGQKIKNGDILAKLDTTYLQYANSIESNNMAIAENTLIKTKESYDTNIKNAEINIKTMETAIEAAKIGLDTFKSRVDALETLYKQGSLAEKEWETVVAEYKAKESEYEGLLGYYETVKKDFENLKQNKEKDIQIASANIAMVQTAQARAQKNISDAVLKADADGYVLDIAFKKGEIVGAGYPVVIAKSEQLIVTIGVSTEDYGKISKESKVKINDVLDGKIDSIALYPDEQTRTYAVDIAFEGELPIGEIVDITILQEEEKGKFVPIESVFNIDGVDYVYVVGKNNRVSRQQIIVEDVKGSLIKISNLEEGLFVVTEGIKTLRENDIVKTAEPGEVDK